MRRRVYAAAVQDKFENQPQTTRANGVQTGCDEDGNDLRRAGAAVGNHARDLPADGEDTKCGCVLCQGGEGNTTRTERTGADNVGREHQVDEIVDG